MDVPVLAGYLPEKWLSAVEPHLLRRAVESGLTALTYDAIQALGNCGKKATILHVMFDRGYFSYLPTRETISAASDHSNLYTVAEGGAGFKWLG